MASTVGRFTPPAVQVRTYLKELQGALEASAAPHAEALVRESQHTLDRNIRDVKKKFWLTTDQATRRVLDAVGPVDDVAERLAGGAALADIQARAVAEVEDLVSRSRKIILGLVQRVAPMAAVAIAAGLLVAGFLGDDANPALQDDSTVLFSLDENFDTHTAHLHDSFQIPEGGAGLGLVVAPENELSGCADVTLMDPAGAVFFKSNGDCGALDRTWSLSQAGTYSLEVAFVGYTGSLAVTAVS